jgi:hypothetical protein
MKERDRHKDWNILRASGCDLSQDYMDVIFFFLSLFFFTFRFYVIGKMVGKIKFVFHWSCSECPIRFAELVAFSSRCTPDFVWLLSHLFRVSYRNFQNVFL